MKRRDGRTSCTLGNFQPSHKTELCTSGHAVAYASQLRENSIDHKHQNTLHEKLPSQQNFSSMTTPPQPPIPSHGGVLTSKKGIPWSSCRFRTASRAALRSGERHGMKYSGALLQINPAGYTDFAMTRTEQHESDRSKKRSELQRSGGVNGINSLRGGSLAACPQQQTTTKSSVPSTAHAVLSCFVRHAGCFGHGCS